MKYLEVSSTVRVSFGIYNTLEDCDKFIEGLENLMKGGAFDVLYGWEYV